MNPNVARLLAVGPTSWTQHKTLNESARSRFPAFYISPGEGERESEASFVWLEILKLTWSGFTCLPSSLFLPFLQLFACIVSLHYCCCCSWEDDNDDDEVEKGSHTHKHTQQIYRCVCTQKRAIFHLISFDLSWNLPKTVDKEEEAEEGKGRKGAMRNGQLPRATLSYPFTE